MANKTVSNLNELTTVSNSDVLLVETSTETHKVTKGNLLKEVNEQLNAKSDVNHTHREYITEDELNSKGLATETFVTNKIAEASLNGGDVDLSGYATKEELSNKSDKTHNHSYNDLTDKPTIPSLDGYATESFVTQKIAEASFGDAGESPTVLIEPNENDIPKVFFEGDIDGMSKTNEKILRFSYISRTKTISGYVKMKWQGTSSLRYPKKNFTIKMFTDETCETKDKHTFKNWNYKANKYVLKANYIDHSHARNIVSARLWGDIVASRTDYDSLPSELKSSPNNGAIDGFPIKLYMNGKYEGLYTWNIGKEGWTYGMTDDENPNYAVLCGEDYNSGCFRALANINGNDWSLEYPDALQSPIKQSWNNAISFVMNYDGEDFKNGLSTYFDVTSLIDYYIFSYFSCGLDSMGKNQIYTTYDGTKWYANMYDMDSTWGLYWNGSEFVSTEYRCQEDYESMASGRQGNLLYQKLVKNFNIEIYDRYVELRKGALSIENVFTRFERFTDIISNDLYSEDGEIYSAIPSLTTNNIKQIRSYTQNRAKYVDGKMYDLIPRPVESISIPSSVTVPLGTSQVLTVTYTPSNTLELGVNWIVDNDTIATINENGVITPLEVGDCVVTATSKFNENVSASCNLTVSEEDTGLVYSITDVTFDGANYIDTDVKLYDTDKSFSVYVDFNGDSSNRTTECTVLHCMRETGNYEGFCLDIQGPNYRVVTERLQKDLSYTYNSDSNQRYLITHTEGQRNLMLYLINEGTSASLSFTYNYDLSDMSNLTLKIGAYKGNNGQIGRYWKGTVNECKVWDRVVTLDELGVVSQ